MSVRHRPLDVAVERLPEIRLSEFVSYAETAAGGGAQDWVAAPGQVDAELDGTPRRLHFAPRRWLVLGNESDLQARVDAACAAGIGTRVDVEGKWVALVLRGPDARRALASTVDVDAVLERRGCAALTLFDCPAVIVRDGDDYRLWVVASYAEAFEAAIAKLGG